MTPQAATKITQMIKDHWNMYLGEEAANLWSSFLSDQDAQLATKAVVYLAERQAEQPKISDLAAVIALLREQERKALARPSCPTCNDDKFVVVSIRLAKASIWMQGKGIESPEGAAHDEYAPCPDCNPNCDVSFKRYDGTWFRGLDPAKAREMMRS